MHDLTKAREQLNKVANKLPKTSTPHFHLKKLVRELDNIIEEIAYESMEAPRRHAWLASKEDKVDGDPDA